MDFQLTEEQKMLRTNVRDFLEREIAPAAGERDKRGPLNREETVSYIKKLMPFGYYIGVLPQEYGGPGLDKKTSGILMEEISRVWAGLGGNIFIAQIAPMLAPVMPEKLRDRLLPRILEGDLIGAGAITEPNVGSDPTAIQTTAILDGDHYVINGTKTWISNGSIADVCNVLAISDRNLGALSICMIMAEREVSPWSATELEKLGQHAASTSEIVFEDCHVPKENLLADASSGYKTLMNQFEWGRSMIAASAAGIAQASIDASIKYAQEREQFGKPIASFQLIQQLIFEMIAETEASRLLAYRALDMIDRGERARMQSSLAKGYATEAAVRTTSKAIQIHGAMGYSTSYPVERYFRDARMLTIPDGTTQVQTLVVGREALGIRAFV